MRLQYVLFGISRQPVDTAAKRRLAVSGILPQSMRTPMIGRMVLMASLSLSVLISASAEAQDVPGIEICTVEKTMERRTSCLQSNVDFLQKTITKLALDHQQKLDAANRQIEGLKSTVIGLQKAMEELQAAQKKAVEDQKKKAEPTPAKDGAK
jgi:TolA-binding protein